VIFDGYSRKMYLNKIKDYLDNSLIKVLVGQRRSGKSFILRELIEFLVQNQKIKRKNILYLNFESESLSFIKSNEELNQVVETYLNEIKKNTEKFYLFFDEIQDVHAWEKTINSLRSKHLKQAEIIITGSNSRLLSSEFATHLTGRYIEIAIFPLSYSEYCQIHKLKTHQESLSLFLADSQMPELIEINKSEVKASYLRAMRDSILLNDIVKKFQVENVDLLLKLFSFLIDNLANPFSINSIKNTLVASGIKANPVTLSNYVRYLEYSFLIHGLERYDIKGKQILEGEKKFYLNDIGFRNFLSSAFDPAFGKKLENYVLSTLLYHGYWVNIGKVASKQEIDFIASKDDLKLYIQVTYLLNSENVINREYGNLEYIDDSWQKIVVSMDSMQLKPKGGIRHIQAWNLDNFVSKIH
jgi:hypothetical protein